MRLISPRLRYGCVRKPKLELHQRLQIAQGGAAASFLVDAADFDGTNDYMSRGTPSGAAASKSGILSYWIKPDSSAGSTDMSALIADHSGLRTPIQTDWTNGNFAYVECMDSSGIDTVFLQTPSGFTYNTSTWYHFLAAWNGATGAKHLYINDVDKLDAASSVVNANADYADASATWYIGRYPTPFLFDGGIAEVYFAAGQYLDLSNASNRAKFISGGKPVNLGSDGSTPTGTAPLIYQHLDDGQAASNFATNKGTGGNFTVTGSLTTYASSPSD